MSRPRILSLLSDQEVANVSRAATHLQLSEGDEYVDLAQLDQGVCRALGTTTPRRRMIARKAVAQHTWDDILTELKWKVRACGPTSDA